MSLWFIMGGIIVMSLSGFMSLLFPKRSSAGQWLSAVLLVIGGIFGLTGSVLSFFEISTPVLIWQWSIPMGRFFVMADPISAFFLLVIFIVTPLGAVYSLGYRKQKEHPDDGKKLGIFYGILAGSMAMVIISRDAVLFLMSWEIMALAAFFALTAESGNPEVRSAGWVYLIAAHMGTLFLFAMFALWHKMTGSFSLLPVSSVMPALSGVLFILSVIGFGLKAGIMPFHVWLPGAHSNAPSHVSAVMSAVMLKMGVYGIIRMTGLVSSNELWQGALLLILGMITGIAGISYALGQRDIKRLLAYSSIENIGIIFMGIGLAVMGRSLHRYELIVLGLSGALLHVLNHGFFKSLLFFGAGGIIHSAHTRDMEKMGGLMKKMPMLGFFFIIGAVSICALPPLNGFISELFIYIGLFKTMSEGSGYAYLLGGIASVSLAVIGSLAVAAFVKILSVVFLGSPRSENVSHAHDPSLTMMLPIGALVCFCFIISFLPGVFSYTLDKAVKTWTVFPDALSLTIAGMAPLGWISILGISVIIGVVILFIYIRIRMHLKPAVKTVTWDCGYAKPDSRMQYTGNSFADFAVKLFSVILLPKNKNVKIKQYFPGPAIFTGHIPDMILDRLIAPFFNFAAKYLPWVRIFQQGQIQAYVLYIFAAVILLFIFFR